MRALKIVLSLIVFPACVIAFLGFAPHLTQYYRFQHENKEYYESLVSACDTVITAHPVGTNRYIALSATDPSLPKIIRDLQPLKIQVWPQRVWILHGGSIEFGIELEQVAVRPNVWALSTACESRVEVVYTANR